MWLTQAHSLTVCVTCRGGGRPRRCGVRSLKVVVQRALIELPGSLRRRCSVEGREEEEEGGKEERGTRRSCRLKREPLRDEDEADSRLITCQSCDITVHRGESASCERETDRVNVPVLFVTGCYGVAADRPDQSWECRRCEESATNAVSLLTP